MNTSRWPARGLRAAFATALAALLAGCAVEPPPLKTAEPRGAATPALADEVLAWIKVNQDTASPERRLVADIIRGDSAQTFNNALAAMAFLLMGERERAERILDWYAAATDEANTDPRRQNFFLNGEARGFYQNAAIRDLADARAGQAIWNGDRWMGDMAWLLMVYQQYGKMHGAARYARITGLLCDLMEAWYLPQETGGYVGSGWRAFDATLHETYGHPEGNIDAYAVFRLCGNEARAADVAAWVLPRVQAPDRPLDQYTWKVMAFGPDYAQDLRHLEDAPGYRKTLTFNGRDVTGFTSFCSPDTNIWCDGMGQVACAWYSVGNRERGDFYTRETEKLIIEEVVDGRAYKAIPYAPAHSPGYDWVDTRKGFVSSCAWYILAAKQFNPMRVD